MKNTEKTNVMRVLDGKKIPYESRSYEPDPTRSGEEIAGILGENPAHVFKTLVTRGKTGQYYVFVIPVGGELELKKAAKAAGVYGDLVLSAKQLLALAEGYKGHANADILKLTKQIQELSEQFGKMVMKRLPQYALTQGVIFPLVRQVAKWIGVSLTKQSFSRGVAKFVPIVGGLVSGVLTFFTFRHQSKKLKNKLKESMMLAYNIQHNVTSPDTTLNIDINAPDINDAEEVTDEDITSTTSSL